MDIDKKKLTQAEMGSISSTELRQIIRENRWDPGAVASEYCCPGNIQSALTVLPLDYAFEFLGFCLRNPRALYVNDICDIGSPHPSLLAPDGDVRTDCYKYRVFKDGELIEQPPDVVKYWRDDLVAFLTACSWGFEGVLRAKHVKFRFMGAYKSNLSCIPFGRFGCDNMVVSCRLFPTSHDAVRAIQITSQLPVSHGYPIHIGDPAEIGIDIMNPYIDDAYGGVYTSDAPPQPPQKGEICLTWAGGVTPEMAIKVAKPPLAIVHHVGRMFMTDVRTEEFHACFAT